MQSIQFENKTVQLEYPFFIGSNDSISEVRQKLYLTLLDKHTSEYDVEGGDRLKEEGLDSFYFCFQKPKVAVIPEIYQEIARSWNEHSVPFTLSLTQIARNMSIPESSPIYAAINQFTYFPDLGEIEQLFYSTNSMMDTDSAELSKGFVYNAWTPLGIFPSDKMPYLYSGNPENWEPQLLTNYQKNNNWFMPSSTVWKDMETQLFQTQHDIAQPIVFHAFRRPSLASHLASQLLNSLSLINHWPPTSANLNKSFYNSGGNNGTGNDAITMRAHIERTANLVQTLYKWSGQLKAVPVAKNTGYLRFSTQLWKFKMPKYFSLQILFQNIHATDRIPAIQYNVDETPIRAYTVSKDENNRPVPQMQIAQMISWSEQWSLSKSICMFMKSPPVSQISDPADIREGKSGDTDDYYISIVIKPDGTIHAHLPHTLDSLKRVTSIEKWETIIRDYVRPQLKDVVQYIRTANMNIIETAHIGNIQYQEEYSEFTLNRSLSSAQVSIGQYLSPLFQTSLVPSLVNSKNSAAVYMKRVSSYDMMLALAQAFRQFRSINGQGNAGQSKKKELDMNAFIKMLPYNFDRVTQENVDLMSTYIPRSRPDMAPATGGMHITFLFSSSDHIHIQYNNVNSVNELGEARRYVSALLRLMEMANDEFKEEVRSVSGFKQRLPQMARLFIRDIPDQTQREDQQQAQQEEQLDGYEFKEDVPDDPAQINRPQMNRQTSDESADFEPSQPMTYGKNVPTIGEEDEEDEDEFDPFNISDSDDDEDNGDDGVFGGASERVEADTRTTAARTSMKTNTKTKGSGINDLYSISLKGKNSVMNERRDKYDAPLYHNEGVKNNNYSQKCQTSVKAQPVMLTKEEFEKQDRSAFDEYLLYGSSPSNEHYYICPRFWCFRKNKAMTLEQVQRGECADKGVPDTILDAEATSTNREDGHVFEFTSRLHVDASGNYIKQNPIFQKMVGKNGETKGVPCCGQATYHNWDLFYANRPDNYYRNPDVFRDHLAQSQKEFNLVVQDTYIAGADKTVGERRMGNISAELEILFQHKNEVPRIGAKQTSAANPLIVRYGVEASANMSFVAAMAEAWATVHDKPTPSLRNFTRYLAKHITVDLFVKYNNGRLLSIFTGQDYATDEEEIVLTEREAQSEFITTSSSEMKPYIPVIIRAYRNFIKYATSMTREVPLTPDFLVDIIVTPHPILFPRGLNVVIIEEEEIPQTKENKETDVRPRLFIHCPKYSAYPVIDPNKHSWVVLKRGDVYEPIYVYKRNPTSFDRIFQMAENKYRSMDEIRESLMFPFLQSLERAQTSGSLCSVMTPQSSAANAAINNTNNAVFRANVSADELFERIEKDKTMELTEVVRNRHGQYIGAIVFINTTTNPTTNKKKKTKKQEMFLYCQPTFPKKQWPYPIRAASRIPKYSYADTFAFLSGLSGLLGLPKDTNPSGDGAFLCKPLFAVTSNEDDEMVVGIFTETYQYYPITPFVRYSEIQEAVRLPKWFIYVADYEDAVDQVLQNATTVNSDQNTITSLQAETHFYALFQKRIRSALSNVNSLRQKQELVAILRKNPKTMPVATKRQEIQKILARLGKELFHFAHISQKIWSKMDISVEEPECSSSLCLHDKWILPMHNLLGSQQDSRQDQQQPRQTSQPNNQIMYYARLADELVRNARIRNYMLKTDDYIYLFSERMHLFLNEMIVYPAELKKWSRSLRAYTVDGVQHLI